ncbi:anti-repressor SinI family protein [Niallia taxi]
MLNSIKDNPELDPDWIELISYAKEIGMSIDNIRKILTVLKPS